MFMQKFGMAEPKPANFLCICDVALDLDFAAPCAGPDPI